MPALKSLESVLQNAVADTIQDSTDLTVAYSGGLDSTVLLHVCQRLRTSSPLLSLHAVHVNHGLSGNAQAWTEHCHDICRAWDIALSIENVSITPKPRTSLEQQARVARYRAIEHALGPNSLTLLAQHQDDQAETYLLQLARGAGSMGLSAMPKRYTSAGGHVFARPFLDVTREQLLAYAQSFELSWIEDESNANQHFYRNFIRHSVMPVLQLKWPSIASTISRSASHHADNAAVVDEYMTLLSDKVIDPQGHLNIRPLLALSNESQMAMLRFWLNPRVSNLPSTAVLHQFKRLTGAQEDAQPECRWGDNLVSRYAGKLYLRAVNEAQPLQPFNIILNSTKPFVHDLLPYRIELTPKQESVSPPAQPSLQHCFILADATLRVEFGGFARVCKLDPKRPSKTIKKWLQEWGVPPWERTNIPILLHYEQVLAVGRSIAIVPHPRLHDTDLHAPYDAVNNVKDTEVEEPRVDEIEVNVIKVKSTKVDGIRLEVKEVKEVKRVNTTNIDSPQHFGEKVIQANVSTTKLSCDSQINICITILQSEKSPHKAGKDETVSRERSVKRL